MCIKQLIVAFDGRIHPHLSTCGILVASPNLEKVLQDWEEVAAASSLFEGSSSRCGRWWESRLTGSPNQIGSPLQESSSLLCWFLLLSQSKHCCRTWKFSKHKTKMEQLDAELPKWIYCIGTNKLTEGQMKSHLFLIHWLRIVYNFAGT